ncbi:hypothetical protein DSM19430T_03740 [Desulfovibrio psychrotolerans]|uniref:Uncharacterized protein n=1 Tax=Desulfovibrio psychrotolerans TaxID=415242 RepID=A0A7J0BPV5_9BACT|nr:hypothetical protein DSM19430T_03740 [Desulfovibrio psychrotolerans]
MLRLCPYSVCNAGEKAFTLAQSARTGNGLVPQFAVGGKARVGWQRGLRGD